MGLVRTLVNPWTARHWPLLGPPAPLYTFDLAVQSLPPTESEVTLSLDYEGELGGLITHFEADLADGVSITTQPTRVDKRNHWRPPCGCCPRRSKCMPV